jgi:hypothetical protein
MAYEEHFQQTSEAKYDCLLFDIDDTLYPLSSGLAMEVKKNIQGKLCSYSLVVLLSSIGCLCFS